MLKAKGISDGIGLGKVVCLKNEDIKPEKIQVNDIEAEKKSFYNAINLVELEIKELINNLSGTEKDIMQAYLIILQDPLLVQETLKIIEQESCNAAYATEVGFNAIIQMFENMEDPYMSARSRDIADMKKKILYKLLNIKTINLSQLEKNTIIVAEELTTSNTAKLDLKNIVGIVTEIGGVNSHTAIMARTYEIPAVTGIKHIKNIIKDGDFVAINGSTGEVFVNPSKEECADLEKIMQSFKQEKEKLKLYKNQLSITKDGHKVELLANIGGLKDTQIAIDNTAEGIGLFRTEFLYMNSEDFPTENEQFEVYKKVAEQFKDQRIIIRTLDIGGDKNLKYMKLPKEENPFLGYRAIRIFLDDKSLFKVQLRAILRASIYGKLAIMLPMISSLEELIEAKKVIQEVKDELKNKEISFNENIEVGIMIEIPSSALMSDVLAKECDFFSIGTNDLIQYTMAVERGNEKVSKLYTNFHPAIIRLIKFVIDNAHKNNIMCGMCGEAAGDALFIPLLVGLGLDEFSMNSSKILQTRKLITELDFDECQKLADDVLKLSSSEEVKKKLGNNLQ